MKAKDTIMSDKELSHFGADNIPMPEGGQTLFLNITLVLEKQAEISFKAGIKEVVDNPKYFIDMEAHKRGDTDDLIMWGWEQAANSKEGQVVLIAVPKEKLKEWGIE